MFATDTMTRVDGRKPKTGQRRRKLPELVEIVSTHRAVPTIEDLPTDLADKFESLQQSGAKWNEDRSRIIGMTAAAVDAFIASVDDSQPGDAGQLFVSADTTRLSMFDLIEAKVRFFHDAAEALSSVAEPLEKIVADCEASIVKARDTAVKGLTKAGAGIESQRAWPDYPDAAERQFMATVEKTTGVMKAIGEEADAKVRAQQARDAVKEFRKLKLGAIELLREAAEGAVSI